jgi:folate-binding protein YgfZ
MTDPLLELPGAVAGDPPDEQVPGHHGDPLAEQRAMARRAGVVDRGNREVIAVPGEERLKWLHLLLSQHVSELPEGSGTEALVLDANGRVQHHMVISHVGDNPGGDNPGGDNPGGDNPGGDNPGGTVWMDVEPGTGEALLAYLRSRVFWSKVQPRDATDEMAVLSVVGPTALTVLAAAGADVPGAPYGSAALPGGGLVRRMPALEPSPVGDIRGLDLHTAHLHAVDLLVPRADVATWWLRLREAGAAAAGMMAYEALRVAALRPRLGRDTDEKTIPHEVGWIPSAVHLAKGCYRGQETVARVANLGRPPRRLVMLHTDAGDAELPAPGDPVILAGRTIGRVGTAVLHHELGGVALALVKRSTPVDADLIAGDEDRVTAVRIDPDSVSDDDSGPRPGRAAQVRAGAVRRQ